MLIFVFVVVCNHLNIQYAYTESLQYLSDKSVSVVISTFILYVVVNLYGYGCYGNIQRKYKKM